jgi:hypothetical protein
MWRLISSCDDVVGVPPNALGEEAGEADCIEIFEFVAARASRLAFCGLSAAAAALSKIPVRLHGGINKALVFKMQHLFYTFGI